MPQCINPRVVSMHHFGIIRVGKDKTIMTSSRKSMKMDKNQFLQTVSCYIVVNIIKDLESLLFSRKGFVLRFKDIVNI